jgi:DNA-binding NarL/FixJ family response regulator
MKSASAQTILPFIAVPGEADPGPRASISRPRAGEPLSSRENEVLRCLAEGLSNSSISEKLAISPFTARNHVQTILQKLDVHTKLAAVMRALHHHLLDADGLSEEFQRSSPVGAPPRRRRQRLHTPL